MSSYAVVLACVFTETSWDSKTEPGIPLPNPWYTETVEWWILVVLSHNLLRIIYYIAVDNLGFPSYIFLYVLNPKTVLFIWINTTETALKMISLSKYPIDFMLLPYLQLKNSLHLLNLYHLLTVSLFCISSQKAFNSCFPVFLPILWHFWISELTKNRILKQNSICNTPKQVFNKKVMFIAHF